MKLFKTILLTLFVSTAFSQNNEILKIDDQIVNKSEFEQIYWKNKKEKILIDRYENILGSGKTHLRYFIHAIHNLKKLGPISSLIDIGIGNADFAINLRLIFFIFSLLRATSSFSI